MRFRLSCLKDNWIDSWSSDQLYNYGADNVAKIYKDADGYSRIIAKFDVLPFYTFLTDHSLSVSSISSCNLKYYDIQNFYSIDKNFITQMGMANSTVEVRLLSSEFDEGTGSLSNAITGSSNWVNRDANTAWSNAGGDAATATLTSTFVNHFDNLNINVKTHLQTLNDSYTSSSGTDSNYGFLIKLLTTSETGATILGSKQFIAKDTQTIFVPEIIVEWTKNYKDESTSFEYGRDNTFGIINFDISGIEKTIVSITSVTLSAVTGSGTAATTVQISTSSNVSFITVIEGFHTFDFNIPSSLSAYTDPILTATYSDGSTTKIKTFELIQDKSLSTSETDNLFNGTAKLQYHISPIDIDLDNDIEFTKIFITPYYVESANQQVNYIFNQTRTIVKGLKYQLVENETNKVIQPFEIAHYNEKQNFILLHNSLLDKDKRYRLTVLGSAYEYLTAFNT
jgi:hypothetical protein